MPLVLVDAGEAFSKLNQSNREDGVEAVVLRFVCLDSRLPRCWIIMLVYICPLQVDERACRHFYNALSAEVEVSRGADEALSALSCIAAATAAVFILARAVAETAAGAAVRCARSLVPFGTGVMGDCPASAMLKKGNGAGSLSNASSASFTSASSSVESSFYTCALLLAASSCFACKSDARLPCLNRVGGSWTLQLASAQYLWQV